MEAQKMVTVYGTEKAKLETGKAYVVTEQHAEKLVKKGSASLKPIKAKEA